MLGNSVCVVRRTGLERAITWFKAVNKTRPVGGRDQTRLSLWCCLESENPCIWLHDWKSSPAEKTRPAHIFKINLNPFNSTWDFQLCPRWWTVSCISHDAIRDVMWSVGINPWFIFSVWREWCSGALINPSASHCIPSYLLSQSLKKRFEWSYSCPSLCFLVFTKSAR